jgi:ribose/xylose/arabinose/galactoside ABC-type transport system permease subunit
MSYNMYALAALALVVLGCVLIFRGRPWPWRLAGVGLGALGLTMLYNLSRVLPWAM